MWIHRPEQDPGQLRIVNEIAGGRVELIGIAAEHAGCVTLGIQRDQAVGVIWRMPLHTGQDPGAAVDDRRPGGIRARAGQVAGLVVTGHDQQRLSPVAVGPHPIHHGLHGVVEVDVLLDHAARPVAVAGPVHRAALETGEVDLASFSKLESLIPDHIKADLEQLKADIIAGKIQTKPGEYQNLSNFRETYPSRGSIHISSIRITILLGQNTFFLHDSKMPRNYPNQGT